METGVYCFYFFLLVVNILFLSVSDGSAIFKGCFHRPDNVTLALPFSAVIQNMSVDKCVDMCTERVRGRVFSCIVNLCTCECVFSVWQLLYFRRNHWPSWLEIDVTAASRLLSSPCMRWKTRTCVSTAATGKSLRAAGTTSTLWCTRRRFKVRLGGLCFAAQSQSHTVWREHLNDRCIMKPCVLTVKLLVWLKCEKSSATECL